MKRYNFICENGHDNFFNESDESPFACSSCSVGFEEERVIEAETNDSREITGLTIIYQITQQRIEISTLHRTILGRSGHGSEVFSKILFNGGQVISREHCLIDFKEGKFYLLDNNSTNGTFYGVNKLSCKKSAHVIEDEGIFFLGEEAFKAHITYKESELEVHIPNAEAITETSKKIKNYKCKKCGKECLEFVSKCSGCGFKNTLIEVYE